MIWILAFSTLALAASEPRDLVVSGRLDDLRWPDFSDFQADVDAFYEPSGYALAWSRNGAITRQAIAAIEILKDADSKGLNPEDYDASRWTARMANPDPPRFDLALTVSAMRYASDLHDGKWNPGIYHSGLDVRSGHDDLAQLLRRLADAADENTLRAVLLEIEPPFPAYRRTQAALQRYLAMARADDGELLPGAKTPIEPGASYPGVPRLATLLRRLGDLPSDAPVADTYSGPLVEAVKRFQTRHGLDSDGRMGKSTLAALNTPLTHRVLQLQFTLERFRWMPHGFARPPIVVNIPEFELRALNESYATELQMKVVVGEAYRRETPVFAARMTYVTFRPYWHVPVSITRAELVPKILHDPKYLAANGYEIVALDYETATNGAIDEETIAMLRSGKLAIRQVPGPRNSLGLIAFLFPNEYDVYLHDTPAPSLFSRSRRDFSHGCIRVEQPVALAQWVLGDMPEWTPERIEEAMHGARTFDVVLKTPIPVMIVYATAVVLQNGEARFFDDLYGFDAQLEALAANGYPSSRWNPTSGARAPHPHE
jgi:murein L,D-transpeptidase YcbB/YkuD